MGKNVSIGIATCVISIAVAGFVQIAVGTGMITQANAIYFYIGLGILFLVGIGFLIYGIQLDTKSTAQLPIRYQANAILPKVNPYRYKLFHAILGEFTGLGLMIGGALIFINNQTTSLMPYGIAILLAFFGFFIFLIGVFIGIAK